MKEDTKNELTKRLLDQLDPWEREEDTENEIRDTLENDPAAIINYLLDIIDHLQG